MSYVNFLGALLSTLLIGYLGFVDRLAIAVQDYLPEYTPQLQAHGTYHKRGVGTDDIPYATKNQNSFERKLQKILLEHSGFQQAALLASTNDETRGDPSDLPLDQTIKNALVNVFCQYATDEYVRTTTGTGVFINQKGIILTNAHVAQFLLLKDAETTVRDVRCVIRSGDPATPKYVAELLYISPTWIYENANLITDEAPRGTGERDYALLYVSKSVDNTPLPVVFPSISVDTALLSRGMEQAQVMTAGYPAEALMRDGADAKLMPVIATTTVGSLYTFGSNYADIFSILESPVGEQGASGGPIVTLDTHTVIGLIVTKGDAVTEGEHSLRALTLSYIDRTITEETGYSLTQNMMGDLAQRGAIFKNVMTSFLANLLLDEIDAY